ncbi:MAG: TIM barrel protein [Planctomycetes bacterium]|nr:TIM barrel protein [Planctomycetota bacterium]
MAIKVGFSSSVCPQWDVQDIATKANEMGFYGVELGTVRDELHLPAAPDLQQDKEIDAVRKLFEDASVEIVSIASKYALEAKQKNVQKRSFDRTVENIALAEKLGCPFVRVPLGKRVGRELADATLARQIPPLCELAKIAARHRVTLLASNTADFASSRDVWFVVDGVSHAGMRAAWDPVLGLAVRENSSVSVPRLGARIKMVLANNASFDDATGAFEEYRSLSEGCVDYSYTTDLLKGVLFDGYYMLDWPKASAEELPSAQDALPAALEFLLERIKHQDAELSAYKKDKQAPNFQPMASFVERKVAAVEGVESTDTNDVAVDAAPSSDDGPRIAKGADPKIAALVAEAVRKVRAARGE